MTYLNSEQLRAEWARQVSAAIASGLTPNDLRRIIDDRVFSNRMFSRGPMVWTPEERAAWDITWSEAERSFRRQVHLCQGVRLSAMLAEIPA